jgi:hypothetical protein
VEGQRAARDNVDTANNNQSVASDDPVTLEMKCIHFRVPPVKRKRRKKRQAGKQQKRGAFATAAFVFCPHNKLVGRLSHP